MTAIIIAVLLVLKILQTTANVVYPRLDYLHPILQQENLHSPDGSYRFGYESNTNPAIAQQDHGPDGAAMRLYSYLDDQGRIQHDFKLSRNDAALPSYTPEVDAARRAHFDAFIRVLQGQTRTATFPFMPVNTANNRLVQTSTTTARPLNADLEVKHYVLPSPTVHHYEKIWPLPPLKFKDLSIEVNGQNWYDPRTQFSSWNYRQPQNVNVVSTFPVVTHQMDTSSNTHKFVGIDDPITKVVATKSHVDTKSSNDVLHAEKAFEIALNRLRDRYNLI